jgi:hypothetical protein
VIPEHGGEYALEVHEIDPNGQEVLFAELETVVLGRVAGPPLDHAVETFRAWLREVGHRPSVLSVRRREPITLDEERAVRLALLFGAIGPLERADRIEAVCVGIARMTREEALYWHGKARHADRNRALKALRVLLADEVRETRPARRKSEVA